MANAVCSCSVMLPVACVVVRCCVLVQILKDQHSTHFVNVAVCCCSGMLRVAVCCSALPYVVELCSVLQFVVVWCCLLQLVAACCSLLLCVEYLGVHSCRVLQCDAVCCSVLQCGVVY